MRLVGIGFFGQGTKHATNRNSKLLASFPCRPNRMEATRSQNTFCVAFSQVAIAYPSTFFVHKHYKEWRRYCQKVYRTKMVTTAILVNMTLFRAEFWHSRDQNGPKNCPFWPAGVHFGPFRSANHTLATPDLNSNLQ